MQKVFFSFFSARVVQWSADLTNFLVSTRKFTKSAFFAIFTVILLHNITVIKWSAAAVSSLNRHFSLYLQSENRHSTVPLKRSRSSLLFLQVPPSWFWPLGLLERPNYSRFCRGTYLLSSFVGNVFPFFPPLFI